VKRGWAIAVLFLAGAEALPAWVESVEFPWNAYPRQLWERELVWIKNIGITHVSLPPAGKNNAAGDAGQLSDVLAIVRRLGIEADLERPVPDELKPLTVEHGGPLTDPVPAATVRLSALDPAAQVRSREAMASGSPAVLWTDVEDTLGPAGFHAGAVNFAGDEKPATAALRRDARLSQYWAKTFAGLHETPGAAVAPNSATSSPSAGAVNIKARQFTGANGISMVTVSNRGKTAWRGGLKVACFSVPPAAGKFISIPGVNVPAGDVVWLPVGVPLTKGPMCKECDAFSKAEHLVYATAELNDMEYENGILAMEFTAPEAAEVILQLSHEPIGPYVAGGLPSTFDWDEHAQRARLKIPVGTGTTKRVRVGLAIDAPDATGFFDSARVLLIGETNHLSSRYSSVEIMQRSRLRTAPELPFVQQPSEEPLSLFYDIRVPETAVHGDHAQLVIEADGRQMSHAEPQLLRPVSLTFPDATQIRFDAASSLPLYPAAIPVNRRTGRDFSVSVRNNAPEIRIFEVEPKAPGLEFSPAKMEVVVGAATAREVSFRVFATDADPGVHAGSVMVTGAAKREEPVQFVVIPQDGAVAYASSGVWILESAASRAAFIPNRWVEFLNKSNNQNAIGAGGSAFTAGAIEVRDNALVFGGLVVGGQRVIRMSDLDALAATVKKR